MSIQWFPGHMAKTLKLIKENLKLVDVVVEILDARIPISSKNPKIDSIIGRKPRIVALNKADLADEEMSKVWQKWYADNGYLCVLVDSLRGKGIKQLKEMVKGVAVKEKLRMRYSRPVRMMVVGIPNVGKSTFINRISGKAGALTGDKPGVTRGKQWIRLNPEIELLDMPGVLWPKFEDSKVGLNLAFTGAVKDEIVDVIEVASALMEYLAKTYPGNLAGRYKLGSVEGKTGIALLTEAGKNRGALIAGGQIDLTRIAAIVLDEFRGGKIGRITLETP